MHHNHNVDITNDGYGYLVVCFQCGKEFEAKRYDSAFCSSTCRSRNHRQKQKLDTDIAKAKALIDSLCERMPRTGESKIYNALNQMIMNMEYHVGNVEAD